MKRGGSGSKRDENLSTRWISDKENKLQINMKFELTTRLTFECK